MVAHVRVVDGALAGFAEYRMRGSNVTVFTHTEVDDAFAVDVVRNLEALGEKSNGFLFDFAPDEPMKTFRNLWRDHPHWPKRLGGLLLAVARRIGELPPGGRP